MSTVITNSAGISGDPWTHHFLEKTKAGRGDITLKVYEIISINGKMTSHDFTFPRRKTTHFPPIKTSDTNACKMNEDLLMENSSSLISETHWSVSFFFLALFPAVETNEITRLLLLSPRAWTRGPDHREWGCRRAPWAGHQGHAPRGTSAQSHPPPLGFCPFCKLVLQPPHGFAELFQEVLCTLLSFTHHVGGPQQRAG